MRMQLLPTMLAAAEVASSTGLPIVRRLDLIWPEHAYAADAQHQHQHYQHHHHQAVPLAVRNDQVTAPFE